METKIIIHVCYFQRKQGGKKEKGIMIGEGGSIIDLDGKKVKEVWDANSIFDEGSFVITKGDENSI